MAQVVVLLGAGSIGKAIVRRIATGRQVVVADLRLEAAQAVVDELEKAGFQATATRVDAGDRANIQQLVATATGLGEVVNLVHAAGVSPSQASVEQILKVDLYGSAVVLEEFGKVIAPGGSGVVISSQSGYRLPALTPEQDEQLATAPTEELLGLPLVKAVDDTLVAYQVSKRGNGLRVKGQAPVWGERHARINSISPGIVITPLAHDELTGPRGAGYRRMLELSPVGRAGTPDEIANLATLLLTDAGGYISGSDFLVDGGVTASWYYGPLKPAE